MRRKLAIWARVGCRSKSLCGLPALRYAVYYICSQHGWAAATSLHICAVHAFHDDLCWTKQAAFLLGACHFPLASCTVCWAQHLQQHWCRWLLVNAGLQAAWGFQVSFHIKQPRQHDGPSLPDTCNGSPAI